MDKYTNDPSKFMDEAEKLARAAAVEKDLAVWRGQYSGFMWHEDETYDCILVGVPDTHDPPPTSAITIAVRLADQQSGAMFVQSDSAYTMIPFGGGWHPLQVLQEEYLSKLPNFSTV